MMEDVSVFCVVWSIRGITGYWSRVMRFFWYFPKLIRALKKDPAFIKELLSMLRNDAKAILGVVKYDFPVIFIAGLPKSGTTWVETQLANISGYNLRPVYDRDGVVFAHDVNDAVFDALPRRRYSILKLHTRYSDENYRVILRHVDRFMVMTRDLRDMCVSAYLHVKNDISHPNYELYNQLSAEDGLLHRIEVTADNYVSWVLDWLEVVERNPKTILLVRYEDLVLDPSAQFARIHEFFHLPMDREMLELAASSRLVGEQDFERVRSESIGLRLKSTARKGIVGDWKNYFSVKHKERFKQLCGNALIRSGYEENLDW